MNKQEFYRRVAKAIRPMQLQKKRAAVVGLGSGGSRVAAELGRLGVSLLLVERPGERLLEHNIVRHQLGYLSLGKPKLSEMVKHIANLNPSTHLTTRSLDVVEEKEELRRLLEGWCPDLVAVCTDNEQSKHAANEVTLSLGVPQVGAGVYDGGIGGEVYRVRPGQACYGCIAAELHLQPDTPAAPPTPDYSRPQADEVRSTCALNMDIEQIAILQSRLCLELLLDTAPTITGVPEEVNLLVFANRVVPGTFARPLHCDFFSIPRRPSCLTCGEATGAVENEADRILASLSAPPGQSA